jgi:hypothetical protein
MDGVMAEVGPNSASSNQVSRDGRIALGTVTGWCRVRSRLLQCTGKVTGWCRIRSLLSQCTGKGGTGHRFQRSVWRHCAAAHPWTLILDEQHRMQAGDPPPGSSQDRHVCCMVLVRSCSIVAVHFAYRSETISQLCLIILVLNYLSML